MEYMLTGLQRPNAGPSTAHGRGRMIKGTWRWMTRGLHYDTHNRIQTSKQTIVYTVMHGRGVNTRRRELLKDHGLLWLHPRTCLCHERLALCLINVITKNATYNAESGTRVDVPGSGVAAWRREDSATAGEGIFPSETRGAPGRGGHSYALLMLI